MKFCPICLKDFDDEKTGCPICGQTLLKGEHLEYEIIFNSQKEELILKLYNYLCENNFHTVQYYQDKNTEQYYITAASSESAEIIQTILLCLNDDKMDFDLTKQEQEAIIKQITDIIKDSVPDEGAKTFINAKERYDNMMSSASSLIIVGIIGFVFVTLVYLKLINLDMNVLFYILSLLMFSVFIIFGISALIKAQKIKKTISTEENLADEIKKFLLTEYNPAASEEAFAENGDITDEEKYFFRTEHMKKIIQEHFESADDLLIEGMIEDVYNEIYPMEEDI